MVRYPFCALLCTLAKEVQLFPCLGIYSGILVMYFQCQSNNSTGRTTNIVFYAICLLYVLSTVIFISDVFKLIVGVSNNSICSKDVIFIRCPAESQCTIFRVPYNCPSVLSSCCEFLAQCILVHINHCTWAYHLFYSLKFPKIYHCWIIWGQNIHVVIIPSFLAVHS